jgi:hypothetical protein
MGPTFTHDNILLHPLRRFAELGQLIELAVPWAKKTLFLVPGAAAAEHLIRQGVSRGRIWTADEVRELLLVGVSREDVIKIAGTKVQFAGTVTGVRRDEPAVRPAAPAVRPTEQLALPIGARA